MKRRISDFSGFTMIELILFILLSSITIPFIMKMFGSAVDRFKSPEISAQAALLGESILEEIGQRRFYRS